MMGILISPPTLFNYSRVLVTPVYTKEKIRFASKSGFGDVTRIIEERFFTHPENNK
jgi:hypothetical protein